MRYMISSEMGIGDFLMALPAAQAIRQADPDAYILFFFNGRKRDLEILRPLFELQNYVDEIQSYTFRELIHSLNWIVRLLFKKYDYAFVMSDFDNPYFARKWHSRLANLVAKTTIGFETNSVAGIKYTKMIKRDTEDLSRRHLYGKMLQAVGIEPVSDDRVIFSQKTLLPYLTEIKKTTRKTIGIALGGNVIGVGKMSIRFKIKLKLKRKPYHNDAKRWKEDRWLELVKKLVHDGYRVFLLGGIREKQILEERGLNIPCGAIDYVGKTSLPESLAIISVCDLFVSVDTGMMHAAHAVGTRLLALFGCTDPMRVFPRVSGNAYITSGLSCSPCYGTPQVVLCEDIKCMDNITVQMVYDKIHEMLLDS